MVMPVELEAFEALKSRAGQQLAGRATDPEPQMGRGVASPCGEGAETACVILAVSIREPGSGALPLTYSL